MSLGSAGFTYRLDNLNTKASKFRGPPAKVYIIHVHIKTEHTLRAVVPRLVDIFNCISMIGQSKAYGCLSESTLIFFNQKKKKKKKKKKVTSI